MANENWFGLPLAQPAWTARAVSRRYQLEIYRDRCGWLPEKPEWLDDTPLDFASTEQWDELLTKWADVVTVVFRQWLDGEGR